MSFLAIGADVFWSRYNDQSNEALYPFGYGLSYTNFEISEPTLKNTYAANGKITCQVNLTNTGKVEGKETVHYIFANCMFKQQDR